MPISKKLTKHLDNSGAKYEIVPHKKVYTALDAAATLKVKLDEIAKSLIVKADKDYYLLILAANKNVNLGKLKKALQAKKVIIPKEAELVKVFKIKPGSLTGFGAVHQLPVIIDKGFEKVRQAIFKSGSLAESIRMNIKDYVKLEEPVKHLFSEVKKIKKLTQRRERRKGAKKKLTQRRERRKGAKKKLTQRRERRKE